MEKTEGRIASRRGLDRKKAEKQGEQRKSGNTWRRGFLAEYADCGGCECEPGTKGTASQSRSEPVSYSRFDSREGKA